ncbi:MULTISPECIES: hypothetical protein [Aeromonas]|uniref:hypothetical protein n=1 Tax=Aeromonas TaxID=642 RepID=UPI002B05825D|nr:hypothetical protein [Aeromonas jandaei]
MSKILVAANLLVSSETPPHRMDHDYFSSSIQSLTDFLDAAKRLGAIPVMVGRAFEKLKVNDAIQVAILLARQSLPVVVCAEKSNRVLDTLSDFAAIKMLGEKAMVYNDDLVFTSDDANISQLGLLDPIVVGVGSAPCNIHLCWGGASYVPLRDDIQRSIALPYSMRWLPGQENSPAFGLLDLDSGDFSPVSASYDHEDMLRVDVVPLVEVQPNGMNSEFINRLKSQFGDEQKPQVDLMHAIDEVVEEQRLPSSVANYAKTLLMR